MKELLLLITFILASSNLPAQQKEEMKLSFAGSAFVATDFKAIYLSMGGPGISMKKKNWTISVNMLPSLRLLNDAPKPFVTPILGGGLMTAYKHLVLGFSFYYISSELTWKIAPGVGYRF